MKKDIFFKKAAKILKNKEKYFDKKFMGKPQENTIDDLLDGIKKKEITTEEALYFALIVGFQWKVNFDEKIY
jgi:hypothetical protein